MLKNKISGYVLAGSMALVGLVAGFAIMAGAETATTPTPTNTSTGSTVAPSTTVSGQAVDTPEPGDVPDSNISTSHAINVESEKTNDADGSAASEGSEAPSSGTSADQ